MNLFQGLAQRHQTSSLNHSFRQMIEYSTAPFLHNALLECAQPSLGDPFGQRVDGNHAPGVKQLLIRVLKFGVAQDQAAKVAVDLAAEDVHLAGP